MLWLGSVAIPYLALIALAVIEGAWARHKGFDRFFITLGMDACILGIGISGALFATPEIAKKGGVNTSTFAVLVVLGDLIITGLCMGFREYEGWDDSRKRVVCFTLGVLVLMVNTAIIVVFE